jgi:hypothetical protein
MTVTTFPTPNALDDQPHEILCDCCCQPADFVVSEFDPATRQLRTLHHWCDRHEHWWQRAIYNLRRVLEEHRS